MVSLPDLTADGGGVDSGEGEGERERDQRERHVEHAERETEAGE